MADVLTLPENPDDWEIGIPYLFQNLEIVIEYLAGDERRKTTKSGGVIAGIMPTAYGYILHTTDVHGEEIDMYLSNAPKGDDLAYVIDQICPLTGMFDEHKVMLGFASVDEVVSTYEDVFSDGSGTKRLGAVTQMSAELFRTWINSEGYSLQPASKFGLSGAETVAMRGVGTQKSFTAPKPIDETGGVEVSLPDLSKGPKILTSSNDRGGLTYTINLFSALETQVWSNLVDQFVRTLDLAKSEDRVKIYIASPGGSVFLMGRLVSAIASTRAHVTTYAQGCVASAATTVWAAGHERHILPGAYFMQHMSSQLLSGKTTDILAKSHFCMEYISRQLQPLVALGLFTAQEVEDMITKHADIFIPGREAVARVGAVSTNTSR